MYYTVNYPKYFPEIKRGIVPMFTVKISGFKNKACKHIEEFVFNVVD